MSDTAQRSVGGDPGTTTPAPKRRQINRMLKVSCPDCGYLVRIARSWLAVATPRCPLHGLDLVMDIQKDNT